MTVQGEAALLKVTCPVCGAEPYQPCVYIWPKGVPRELAQVRNRHDLQRVARVGQPTKQPHAGRWNMAAAQRQQRSRRVSAMIFHQAERTAAQISAAEAEWDRREVLRLRQWLARNAGILFDPPRGRAPGPCRRS